MLNKVNEYKIILLYNEYSYDIISMKKDAIILEENKENTIENIFKKNYKILVKNKLQKWEEL